MRKNERKLIKINSTGKDLLDWIGLGTGPNVDPYLARTNGGCLNGDLAECFKSRALQSLDEFFDQVRSFFLNLNLNLAKSVKIIFKKNSIGPK